MSAVEIDGLVQDGFVSRDVDAVEVGQDTVKLHVSDVAWVDHLGRSEKIGVTDERPLKVLPGEIATAISQERFDLDQHTGGVIYPRGRLLPIGVIVPTTHIDPGFRGHLRMVIFNLSPNLLTLPIGYEVARAVLVRIPNAAPSGYQGVNAELRSVNPSAQELMTAVEATATGELQAQLRSVEENLSRLTKSRRDRRLHLARAAIALGLVGVVAVAALASVFVASGPFEAIVAVIAGGALLALGGMMFRPLLGRAKDRVERWIAN